MENEIDKLNQEVEGLKTKLIAQDHRLVHSLLNVFRAKNKSNRMAALGAVFWNLVKSPATVSISVAGVVGVFLAYNANSLLENQNKLIEKQNDLITSQNRLSEAGRRANLVPELTRVFDEITVEARNSKKTDGKLKLSQVLEARIIALSKALRPYYFLYYHDEISKHELSPERGQLLLTLTESNVDLSSLGKKADFSWALLSRVRIEDKDFLETNLGYLNADGAYIKNCNFSKSNLWGAQFSGADIIDCDLSGLKLNSAKLLGTRFRGTNLAATNFFGALLPFSYGFQDCNLQGAKFHQAYVTDSTWLDDLSKMINNPNIFDRSKYRLRVVQGEQKIQIEDWFGYLQHDPNNLMYQIEHLDSARVN